MSAARLRSRHGRGLNARADGPLDGVYIDGVHVFAVNVSAATVTPRGMFGTRTPPGASEGVNGVELLDFFAYVKSFHRTLDPQPQDGDAPTVTVTFFDGPMPVTTYELENLNPALPPHAEGPTGDPTGMFLPSCPALGVPLMETDADGALLSRGRVDGFGLSISGGGDPITPEGGFNRDQIYCLVNGRRSTAAVVGDGALLTGATVASPELRWVFTTDAVGTATSFARQQAGDSQTPDSFGGGAGTPTALASPPVWDTANIPLTFGTTAPPREDRTTSARPLRPESEVGPTTVQNTDAGFNTDEGDCLCRGCDPSKQTVTRKNDASTGATTTLNDGAYADTHMGAYINVGSTSVDLDEDAVSFGPSGRGRVGIPVEDKGNNVVPYQGTYDPESETVTLDTPLPPKITDAIEKTHGIKIDDGRGASPSLPLNQGGADNRTVAEKYVSNVIGITARFIESAFWALPPVATTKAVVEIAEGKFIENKIKQIEGIVEAVKDPIGTVNRLGEALTSQDQEVQNKAAGSLLYGLFEAGAMAKAGATAAKAIAEVRAAKAANTCLPKGTTTVYQSVSATGKVQYVGITDDLARRAAEHLRKRGFNVVPVIRNLPRQAARNVEQALIEIHKLQKDGGTLLNKINAIAKTNPEYAKRLSMGHDILKSIGYR